MRRRQFFLRALDTVSVSKKIAKNGSECCRKWLHDFPYGPPYTYLLVYCKITKTIKDKLKLNSKEFH